MMADEKDYVFEYSSDSSSDAKVDLSNQYYKSKGLKDQQPLAALKSFQIVLDLENGNKEKWGFKALKQMMKINFKLENYVDMLIQYKQLLTYIEKAVTRNHSEKSINSILDYVSTLKDTDTLENCLNLTINALKSFKNYRLWYKATVKLGNLYLKTNKFIKLKKVLSNLYGCCQQQTEGDAKNLQLIEIFSIEMQMCVILKMNRRLKSLYRKFHDIDTTLSDPLIIGIIYECGGKMHFREENFESSYNDFHEAFTRYNNLGLPRKITCLKYIVFVNMFVPEKINLLDFVKGAKPYINYPEILTMKSLAVSYENNDFHKFQSMLHEDYSKIMEDDDFLRENLEGMLTSIRKKLLIALTDGKTEIELEFMGRVLNIETDVIESLLVSCILDKKIKGKIDQINNVLKLDQNPNDNSR